MQALLDALRQLGTAAGHPVDADPIGDVFEDRLWERIRFLEHHPDAPSKGDDVDSRLIDVGAIDQHLALDV